MKIKLLFSAGTLVLCLAAAVAGSQVPLWADEGESGDEEDDLPVYLRDRGTGMATSMFGTYIHKGELLVYPFFEDYRDHNAEYSPDEFGYGLDQDYRGKYRATEGLLFLAYGLSDRFAVELEAAVIKARLETSPDDPTAVPERIEESGLGDVEGQLRYRWLTEDEDRPEVFSFFETVFPLQKDRLLIGTAYWEFALGVGLIKGFSWGTLTLRTSAAYEEEDSKVRLGEYAIDYLKKLSPAWRIYVGLEGEEAEVELIPELQWWITDRVRIKLNSAFGVTSKATDWAPEVGVMISFPPRDR